ncbi:large ribosomal subunit protein cL38 [Malania oleifera]|uniref:large ribosomal subunit protein cL38 n=1 Tax=Malania oleifera TaxID=397392 RepID=UPI0025ADFFF6|nr:large ribosomal subunit protein cL38 [Malania oleifera]
MSISAIFGTRIAALPNSSSGFVGGDAPTKAMPRRVAVGGGTAVIECSSRPKKKATAHHMKTRPRKSQLWDIKRRPTVYPPLPPMPPEWTLVSPAADADASAAEPPAAAPSPSQELRSE